MPDVKPAAPVVFEFQGSLTQEVVATLVGETVRPVAKDSVETVLQIDFANPSGQAVPVRIHSFDPKATILDNGSDGLIADVVLPPEFNVPVGETVRAAFKVKHANTQGAPKRTELIIYAKADPA